MTDQKLPETTPNATFWVCPNYQLRRLARGKYGLSASESTSRIAEPQLHENPDCPYEGCDVDGLLRRGYDVFLQYTNYGDREIRMRLPQGLPVSREQWSQFIDGERLVWKPDKK